MIHELSTPDDGVLGYLDMDPTDLSPSAPTAKKAADIADVPFRLSSLDGHSHLYCFRMNSDFLAVVRFAKIVEHKKSRYFLFYDQSFMEECYFYPTDSTEERILSGFEQLWDFPSGFSGIYSGFM